MTHKMTECDCNCMVSCPSLDNHQYFNIQRMEKYRIVISNAIVTVRLVFPIMIDTAPQ